MIHWEVIDSGALPAQENMDFDGDLLAALKTDPKHILRFYSWKNPSMTYGHFINPSDFLNCEAASQLGVDLARRPTGGGVICHFTDFTFSILVPKDSPYYTPDTLKNYQFVNDRVKKCVEAPLRSRL